MFTDYRSIVDNRIRRSKHDKLLERLSSKLASEDDVALIRETPDGSNHAILLGLRQLKDPAMRPLFQRLLSSDQPALRIDGLLALAETGTGSIDPFLLQQLPASERIIANLDPTPVDA